jgi:hypothetical protein
MSKWEGKVDEGKFYIGREYDIAAKKLLDNAVLYDADDLTTHGVVVGMTGSGKTGLCIDILEEAALSGIPALLVDPKGDLGNLLLHFPQLRAEDFQPWIDADEARREGQSIEQRAAEISALWHKGLADWGLQPERIARVCQAVEYAVFTPGSDAGFPVSVIASLKAPQIPWNENREILRERISSTVAALLGLVGIEADPVQSREHILLANIFESLWQAGHDLDLSNLIQLVQSPPFAQLGALGLEQVFPQDERFKLAMALNNLLASPTFQTWTEGAPLDIQSLLWSTEGKPRHSVFYLAHLSENERMFFVTLLLSSLETWMYTQPGSSSLRALLYFDEVFGYLPPVAKPPSKPPMLSLLKQARAFGLGLLLATQNPVDLDYKGLSNAGTWFVGRLQTERDKERLLDGLEGAAVGESGFERGKLDKLISTLDKRVFLLHNVHEKKPRVFQTRWAMAYLKGPIMRNQIGDLNDMVGARMPAVEMGSAAAPLPAVQRAPSMPEIAQATRPVVPAGVEEVFLPSNVTMAQALQAAGRSPESVKVQGVIYLPALLAQAVVRYLDRKSGLDHEQKLTALVHEPDKRGVVRWEEVLTEAVDMRALDPGPAPQARFAPLIAPLDSAQTVKRLQGDFLDFAYYHAGLKLWRNATLNLVAAPGTSKSDFHAQCVEAARQARDEEAEQLKAQWEKKVSSIQAKLTKEERELAEDQTELSARKMEEMATHAENVLGLFSGSRSRRRVSSSLTKRRLTAQAKADVDESLAVIEELKKQLAALESEVAAEMDALDARWEGVADKVDEMVVKPYKKDILPDVFGVAWMPYWQLEEGGQFFQLAAYAPQAA